VWGLEWSLEHSALVYNILGCWIPELVVSVRLYNDTLHTVLSLAMILLSQYLSGLGLTTLLIGNNGDDCSLSCCFGNIVPAMCFLSAFFSYLLINVAIFPTSKYPCPPISII
jgi:hypothetical protein